MIIKKIFNLFQNRNKEIYLVGGASRAILQKNKIPYDLDFSTNATPEDTLEILKSLKEFNKYRILDNYKIYGTIFMFAGNFKIEITTTRKDIKCLGRDVEVKFCEDFSQDSKRRDFTINAIYYNFLSNKVMDFHNGIEDLEKKNIKFIGNAEKRIKEDYLRILRYFRFCCSISNKVSLNLLNLCISNKEGINRISYERISDEFEKAFNKNCLDSFLFYLINFGIINKLLPQKRIDFKLKITKKEILLLNLIKVLEKVYKKDIILILKNIEDKLIKTKNDKKILYFYINNIYFFNSNSNLDLENCLLIYENLTLFEENNLLFLKKNKKIKYKFFLKEISKNKLKLTIDKTLNINDLKETIKTQKLNYIKKILNKI